MTSRLRYLVLCAVLTGCATPAVTDAVPPTVAVASETLSSGQQDALAPAPAPTSTPDPVPTLTRLTEPGCCTLPEWSVDSTQVRFIDRPSSTQSAALYAVGLEGGPPFLVSQRLGEYSPDQQLIAYLEAGETTIEQVTTSRRWTIDNGGRRVFFSPGSNRLLWSQSLPSSGGFDQSATQIFVAPVAGTPLAEPFAIYGGGGFNSWLDDDHLLVVGKPQPEDERGLFTLSLADRTLVELARGERMRGGIPAPGGAWVAYLVLFDQEHPADNGIWIVGSDGQGRFQLEDFGAFQWRDETRLLIVPQEPGASHRLLQVDATTAQVTPLTDPAATPFVIEGGDWQVSPDGRHIAFVSATDRAIWLLTLP